MKKPEFDDARVICRHCEKKIHLKIEHGLWGCISSHKAVGRVAETYSSVHKINCPHCGRKIRLCIDNYMFVTKHPILMLNGEEI